MNKYDHIPKLGLSPQTPPPKDVYACIHVEKTVQDDHFQKGCDPNSAKCVLGEKCNIAGESVADLVNKLGMYFGLDIDDIFIPGEEGDSVGYFGYNRLEDAEGNEPSKVVMGQWKKGKVKLYLADYSFVVEKRVVSDIEREAFVGLKTHG